MPLDVLLRSQQHNRIGVLASPLAKPDNARFGDEGDRFTLSFSGDGCPFRVVQWIPQALGFAIEDQKDVLVNISADAELIRFVLAASSVNHGQLGKWSPTDGNGFPLEHVVDQFVMVEQCGGVSPCDALVDVADNHDVVIGFRFFGGSIGAGRNAQ